MLFILCRLITASAVWHSVHQAECKKANKTANDEDENVPLQGETGGIEEGGTGEQGLEEFEQGECLGTLFRIFGNEEGEDLGIPTGIAKP
jgi:hypothetical protein